jgi:biotin carboxyl carrier protein
MIKHLRVTVDGHSYYVTVELADESGQTAAPASAPLPVAEPKAPAPPPPAPSVAAQPAAAPATSPPAGPAGPGDVPSPLAGWVVGVDVSPGQQVNAGDKLLTLEAMKMNTFVNAPASGKVAEVLVAVGAAVEQGQVLVRIQ